MSSVAANSDRIRPWVPLLVLLGLTAVLRPVETRLVPPGFRPPPSGSLAVLGGLRGAAAGVVWLRAHRAWERQDEAATWANLGLALSADDRPLYYWLNAARITAYDFPSWRGEAVPAAVQARIRREAAERALALLERARNRHPDRAEIPIEMANIQLRVLGDKAAAAEWFRCAAELPRAPWHAARIHAELLREMGRPGEALAYLRQLLPRLPADDPAARRDVVAERIRELEAATSP